MSLDKHTKEPVSGQAESNCPGCELEHLRAENARLTEALRSIAFSARTKTGIKAQAKAALFPPADAQPMAEPQ